MIKDSEATECSISFSVTPVQTGVLNLSLIINWFLQKFVENQKLIPTKTILLKKIIYCRTSFKASPSWLELGFFIPDGSKILKNLAVSPKELL